MFAVGHFALGYLTGKLSSKILNVPVSLPLIFLASIFADADILFPFIIHRGPMHSIFFWCLIFIPFITLYKKRAIPYLIAVIQHNLVGDFLTGGSQLLWPISLNFYGLDIGIHSTFNIAVEWFVFVVAFAVLFKENEVKLFFEKESTNFVLIVPLMTVLLPIIVNFPLYIPIVLIIPHVFFIGLFGSSLFLALR